MADYLNITTTPIWSNLDFDSEIDDKMLLIEVWCSMVASTKNRFTRNQKVEMTEFLDDDWVGAEEFKEQLIHPGPDFVHPKEIQKTNVFADWDKLAIKYGETHFRYFLQDLYDTYPKGDKTSPEEYMFSINTREANWKQSEFGLKWNVVIDLLTLITQYLDES